MKLLWNLSIKDAIMLAIIILSYLENKKIDLNDIANLLECDIKDLQENYKKVLLLFRDNINEYFINALNYMYDKDLNGEIRVEKNLK